MSLHRLQPAAEKHWARTDKVMHRLSKAHPIPPEQQMKADDGFAALVMSITHQQVSMAAGRSIHAKLIKVLGGKVTPRRVLNRTEQRLRSAGLSRAKATYVLDLADKTLRGDVEFARFPGMTDEAIIEELTSVKGIGTWTAKMFLLFHLQRPDVFAPEDLGLRLGVANAYGVPPEKAAAKMEQMREKWSPYNSVGARVLWQSRH
ncbi:MAG TPA: DNA-3-methyladenine glycosylase 2 family protein [Candidatus Thermoplasmatota archaeon]|nr:DNA-3-methyladenine glycosylase 2 family protein [Candidatus Thermoplasmatota archaeon]